METNTLSLAEIEQKRFAHNAYMRQYNERNRERTAEAKKAYGAAYRGERKAEFAAKARVYYLANRDKIIARSKAHYADNREAKKAYVTKWQKELSPEKRAEYRANANVNLTPERIAKKKAAGKIRYDAKRDELLAWCRAHHHRNREKRLAQKRVWSKANLHLHAHYSAKRRGLMFQATPAWANEFFVEEAFHIAAVRTAMTGQPWEVDHIVPLDSKLVCGLHWEGNFQVVPRLVNRSKGNRTWPGMP